MSRQRVEARGAAPPRGRAPLGSSDYSFPASLLFPCTLWLSGLLTVWPPLLPSVPLCLSLTSRVCPSFNH